MEDCFDCNKQIDIQGFCNYCNNTLYCEDCIINCDCGANYCKYCEENIEDKCIICKTFCHIEEKEFVCEYCIEDYCEKINDLMIKKIDKYTINEILNLVVLKE